MSSYITVFFKTEVTVIPGLLDKYLGKYYNNALCNGATWMFAFWYLIHLAFDSFFNALLIKMKYREYIRIRLKKSIWYLGFYSTALLYTIATLITNNSPLIDSRKVFDHVSTPSTNFLLGFIVVMTFYLHSSIWERLKHCDGALGVTYFLLFLISIISYFLRFIDGLFKLTALICVSQVILEFLRCVVILMRTDNAISKVMLKIFFITCTVASSINYVVVVPYALGYPLLINFSFPALHLLAFLFIWFMLEVHNSVLYKILVHSWLHYGENAEMCYGNVMECSLFPPRCDSTYYFSILKREIEAREELQLSLRKPKNRNVVVQTLKCMVAIKKKLKEKRARKFRSEESDGENTREKEKEIGISPVIFRESVESQEESELVNGKLQFRIQATSSAKDNNRKDDDESTSTPVKYKED